MKIWEDTIHESLSAINELSAKLPDKTIDRLVADIYDDMITNSDYDMDRGLKENEIVDFVYEKIAEIVSMHYDSELPRVTVGSLPYNDEG